MNTAVDITLKAAVTLALVLLLALGVPCLANDTNGDGTRGPEASAYDSLQRLEQRLHLMEEMLLQQRTEIARQAEKLTHQQFRMAYQEGRMRQLLKDRREDRSELQVLRKEVGSLQLERAESAVTPHPKSSEAKPFVSADHNRSSRSDDLGPLQATVFRLDQTVTQLTAQTQVLSSKSDAASASAFVRWGHAQCPDHSDLVYSGVVGGSWFQHKGAATNYLCLTMKPTFSGRSPPSTYFGQLFGAEYETFDSHMNQDPVCAVCRARMSATVMIPGTDTCMDGWTRQFSGYLMAGYWDAVADSEFICVDSGLQSRAGTTDDHNGKLLYYVLTRCGSLPCEPYVNNKVVSCVVCSKCDLRPPACDDGQVKDSRPTATQTPTPG